MRGTAKPSDAAARGWRYVTKASVVSAGTSTAIGVAPSRVAALSAGIKITLLARQALFIRRYIASASQVANDASLFVFGAQFEYQISPFSLTSAPFAYPAMEALAVASAGSTTGQVLTNVGFNFALFDDWLEFDDTTLGSANALLPGPIQLQSSFQVANIAAAGKSIAIGESCVYEIWEKAIASERP